MTKFYHKEDKFDDLFSSAESIYQVRSLAIMDYKDEGLVEFNRLREQRLQTLPLDLLATTLAIESHEPKQRHTKEPPVTTKEHKKVQEETQTKEQEHSNIEVNVDTQIDPKLLQEWQQFDSIISNLECSKDTETSKAADTQETTSKQVPSGTSGLPSSKEV